ncbi:MULTISPECIES: tetratricopeptide repeat protein [Pacificimonas]|nr:MULTISPECIES: tetratricopeptide repeat protein [Pacificimonas]MBZ6378559.1 tetratricopeptide repeat protein [Pacificimonas aurantium]
MNKLILAGGAAVILGGLSSVAFCAPTEPEIAPRSVSFASQGEDLLGANQPEEAILQFETALAVDPKNVNAYLGLARAHKSLGLPGRAVKFYREGLTIDPTNLTALEEQGDALVERGAIERAEENLARIREICEGECDAASRLARKIESGPPAEMAEAAPDERPATN